MEFEADSAMVYNERSLTCSRLPIPAVRKIVCDSQFVTDVAGR